MIGGLQCGLMDYNPFYEETLSEIEKEYEALLPEVATNEVLHERETRFISYLTKKLFTPEERWNKKKIQTVRNMLTACSRVLKERNESIEPRNSELLVKLHKFDIDEACKIDDGDLFHKLGYLYLMGTRGVPKDERQALKLFVWAAEKGNIPSKYNLGLCFLKGTGVPKDEKKGFKLILEALEAGGDSNVYHCLGRCYEFGMGTEINEENSFGCYEAAASGREHCAAIYDLARCYENGFGTKLDLEEALVWYQLDAEKGYSGACQAIERVKNELKERR